LASRLQDSGRTLDERRAALTALIKIEREMPDLGAIHAILGLGLDADTDLETASLLGNAARELATLASTSAIDAAIAIAQSQSERTRIAAVFAITGAMRDGRLSDSRIEALLSDRQTLDTSPRVREIIARRGAGGRK
jgi:hypothetical protein